MTRYVLDTTFIVDVLRGVPAAGARFRRFFEEGDDPVVTEVVVCEAATGTPSHPDDLLTAVLEQTEFVQPFYDVPLLAGQLRAAARRQGRTLSLPDALIAAFALSDDSVVLTRNVKDFGLTAVRVETY